MIVTPDEYDKMTEREQATFWLEHRMISFGFCDDITEKMIEDEMSKSTARTAATKECSDNGESHRECVIKHNPLRL